MKVSIRMKIFLPVVFISILFPLAFWLVFSQTLSAHMTYNARRELERLIRQAERITKEEREDLKRALENPEEEVEMDEAMRQKAVGPLARMLELAK